MTRKESIETIEKVFDNVMETDASIASGFKRVKMPITTSIVDITIKV